MISAFVLSIVLSGVQAPARKAEPVQKTAVQKSVVQKSDHQHARRGLFGRRGECRRCAG